MLSVTSFLILLATFDFNSANQPPPADALSPELKEFCVTKADGNYVMPNQPCSQRFISCSNGITYNMPCVDDLYFDQSANKCLRLNEVAACGGAQPADDLPVVFENPDDTGDDTDEDAPVVDAAYCHGKQPGARYPVPDGPQCSKYYVECVQDGRMFVRRCPAPLMFQPAEGRCMWKNDVQGCEKDVLQEQRESVAETGDGADDDDTMTGDGSKDYEVPKTYKNPRPAPPQIPRDIPRRPPMTYGPRQPPIGHRSNRFRVGQQDQIVMLDFDCSQRSDGDYADPANPCSNHFFTCSNGIRTKRDCPSGLVFDQERDRCLGTEELPACGGVAPAPADTPRVNRPVAPVASPPIGYRARVPQDQPKNDFDCSRMTDGNYADTNNPCTGHFYACSNGVLSVLDCPSGLFFDQSSNQCQRKEEIASCGGRPSVNLAPSDAGVRVPSAGYGSRIQAEAPIAGSNCAQLTDGNYEDPVNPCSDQFISCSNGLTYVQKCPTGLVFDQRNNQCLRTEEVAACGGRATANDLPVVQPEPSARRQAPQQPRQPAVTYARKPVPQSPPQQPATYGRVPQQPLPQQPPVATPYRPSRRPAAPAAVPAAEPRDAPSHVAYNTGRYQAQRSPYLGWQQTPPQYYHQGAGYQGAGYQGAGYQGAGYQGAGYQGAGYQGAGYQGAGYQGSAYQGGYPAAGYQDAGGYADPGLMGAYGGDDYDFYDFGDYYHRRRSHSRSSSASRERWTSGEIADHVFCKGRSTGNYPLPGAAVCSPFYVRCYREKARFNRCRSSRAFHPAERKCVAKSTRLCTEKYADLTPGGGTVNSGDCRNASNGDLVVVQGDCVKDFGVCYEKSATKHVCPGLSVISSQIVGNSVVVQCQVLSQCIAKQTEVLNNNDFPLEDNYCKGKSQGFLSQNTCSQKYALCYCASSDPKACDIQLIRLSCTNYRQVFDKTSRQCISKRKAPGCRRKKDRS